jgi:hypothetical protein
MAWQGLVLMIALGTALTAGVAATWALLLVRRSAAESARHTLHVGHGKRGEW